MTILITRPKEQAENTKILLDQKGFQTHVYSLLEVENLNPTIPNKNYQAVLLTSQSAAKNYHGPSKKAICVGSKTFEEASKNAFTDLVNVDGTARELIIWTQHNLNPEQGPLLYCSGEHITRDLEQELPSFDVDRIVVYDMKQVTSFDFETILLFQSKKIKSVLFYSARTAEAFAKIVNSDTMDLRSVTAFCLSPQVADKIKAFPWKTIIVPKAPTQEGLFWEVTRHHEQEN